MLSDNRKHWQNIFHKNLVKDNQPSFKSSEDFSRLIICVKTTQMHVGRIVVWSMAQPFWRRNLKISDRFYLQALFLYFKMFIFTSIFKHNGISNLPLITSSTEQERQTDTKYACCICGKFNGNDNSRAIIQECLGDLAG